jgi:hypothetical protein
MMEEIDRRLALWVQAQEDMDIAITLLHKLHESVRGKGFNVDMPLYVMKGNLHAKIDEIIQHLAESKWRNK